MLPAAPAVQHPGAVPAAAAVGGPVLEPVPEPEHEQQLEPEPVPVPAQPAAAGVDSGSTPSAAARSSDKTFRPQRQLPAEREQPAAVGVAVAVEVAVLVAAGVAAAGAGLEAGAVVGFRRDLGRQEGLEDGRGQRGKGLRGEEGVALLLGRRGQELGRR